MAFTAGSKLTATLLNNTWPATVSNRQNTVGSITSTGYTATLSGGTACGVAFTAPLSGKVRIHFATAGFNSGANDNKSAVRVRTGSSVGSGTVVFGSTDADLDNDMILYTGSATYRISGFTEVTGLTPGSSYNAQMLHRVSAGTGSFLFKFLQVAPIGN